MLKRAQKHCKTITNNSVSEVLPARLILVPNVKHAINLTSDVILNEHLKKFYYSFIIAGRYQLLKLWINEDCKVDTKEIAALMVSIGSKNQFKQDYISTNTVSSSVNESNKKSST